MDSTIQWYPTLTICIEILKSVQIFSGKMEFLNQPDNNLTVHSHGVFCGSIKFPQNVGDDDWAAWFAAPKVVSGELN